MLNGVLNNEITKMSAFQNISSDNRSSARIWIESNPLAITGVILFTLAVATTALALYSHYGSNTALNTLMQKKIEPFFTQNLFKMPIWGIATFSICTISAAVGIYKLGFSRGRESLENAEFRTLSYETKYNNFEKKDIFTTNNMEFLPLSYPTPPVSPPKSTQFLKSQ